MARRASFGRAPRVTQSLTNTLVAIAREMQSRRDSNLIDAWKSGGMFEGQKATDELVLAHWRKRLAAVSKDDPMWDTYNNAYMQYDYAIQESKMSVEHAHGRISDTQAAQFYLNWSKKVPRNSEFWRVLQRDGAQMMERARAKAEVGRRQREEDAYNAQQNAMDSQLKPANYLKSLLTDLAQNGAFQQTNMVAGPSPEGYEGQGIGDLLPEDPGTLSTWLSSIQENRIDMNDTASQRGQMGNQGEVYVYTDPKTGKAMTGNDIIAAIRLNDPNFDGNLTPGYIASVFEDSLQVLDDKIALADSTGHVSEAARLSKERAAVYTASKQVASYPAQKSYIDLHNRFAADMKKPGLTPKDIFKLGNDYSNALRTLASDPSLEGNDFMRNKLLAEANWDGGPTMFDSFGNNDTTGQGGATKETVDLSLPYLRAVEAIKMTAPGSGYLLTQGKWGEDGNFLPMPGGREFGPATLEAINGASPAPAHIVYIQTANGPQAVYAIGSNITASATYPNGEKPPKEGSDVVGAMYEVPGLPRTVGYQPEPGGPYVFDVRPPWLEAIEDGRIKISPSDSGYHLDVSGMLPTPDPVSGKYGLGAGAFPLGMKPDGKGGVIIDFTTTTHNADPARVSAGNSLTGSGSLMTATMLWSVEGRAMMTQLRDDPTFKAQLDSDFRKAAGFKPGTDENGNPTWVGGNEEAYNRFVSLGRLATDINLPGGSIGGFITQAAAYQDKTSPRPAASYGVSEADKAKSFMPTLPMDDLKGTRFEQMGTATLDGTNLLNKQIADAGKFLIDLGPKLKLPDVAPTVKSTITTAATAAQSANSGSLGAFIAGQTAPAPTMPTSNPKDPLYRGPR